MILRLQAAILASCLAGLPALSVQPAQRPPLAAGAEPQLPGQTMVESGAAADQTMVDAAQQLPDQAMVESEQEVGTRRRWRITRARCS